MTTAERMNEITTNARIEADRKKYATYEKYVKSLIGDKIAKTAKKGKNYCKIRVKGSVPLWEVADRLSADPRNFRVKLIYGTFAKYIEVNW